MTAEDKKKANESTAATEGGQDKQRSVPKVHWDDSELRTSYANVVNAEVTIKLSERIILNPLAAKRLFLLLGGVLKDYESRYGTLEIKGSVKPGE